MNLAMKYLYRLMAAMAAVAILPCLSACNDDDEDDNSRTTWDRYEEYREANNTWILQQEALRNPDGSAYYQRLQPAWNTNSYILIHWFNDRAETAGNLRPLLTSTVNVWYVGRNYRYEVFDADTVSTTGTTFSVNGVVTGWQTALQNMNVGDSVEIILPYNQAYGSSSPSNLIPPYSALRFNIRLRDIPTYEVRP